MKRNLILSAVIVLCASWTLAAQYSWNTPNEENGYVTQTFAVENMTCAVCPITVKKAMSRVDGVQSVEANFAGKTVTVIFDPAFADTAAIAEASTLVGYPAHVFGDMP